MQVQDVQVCGGTYASGGVGGGSGIKVGSPFTGPLTGSLIVRQTSLASVKASALAHCDGFLGCEVVARAEEESRPGEEQQGPWGAVRVHFATPRLALQASEASQRVDSFQSAPEHNELPYEERGWAVAEEAWSVLITSLVRDAFREIKSATRPAHVQVSTARPWLKPNGHYYVTIQCPGH